MSFQVRQKQFDQGVMIAAMDLEPLALDALRDGRERTTAEVAARAGLDEDVAAAALRRLERDRFVTEITRHQLACWRISSRYARRPQ